MRSGCSSCKRNLHSNYYTTTAKIIAVFNGGVTETQKGHNCLRCTKKGAVLCHQPYGREDFVDDQIVEAVSKTGIPVDRSDQMLAALADDEEKAKEALAKTAATLEAEIAEVSRRLDALLDLNLTKEIDWEIYAR